MPRRIPPPTLANAGILIRIRHSQGRLAKAATRIADYVEQQPHKVIRMSITELAEVTATSEGSVVNFCRTFGADGFQDLKILLTRELVEPVQMIQEDLQESDDAAAVSRRVFAAHATSLADTQKLLSITVLERAVAILRQASRIEVYGIGSSAPVAQDLAYRLLQIGRPAAAVVDSHVQAVSASMLQPGAAAITISHSGSTVETVDATSLAKQAGASTIGITRLGKSPLARHCDLVLHTVAAETLYRPEAMSSRVAQLAIIDTLVSCCALADATAAVARLEQSSRVIARKRY